MAGYEHIRGNLTRQMKGMELLLALLEEEFSLLRERKTEEVVALEFSIHELLRQLADERGEIRAIMQDTRVTEYAEMLEPEQCATIKALARGIEEAERKTTAQAGHNTRLSLALMDQSQSLLDFLHDRVAPALQPSYGGKRGFRARRSIPALLSGRA